MASVVDRKKPKAADVLAGAHLQAASDAGTPREKKVTVTFTLHPSLIKKLDEAAARRHVSRAAYVAWVLSEAVKDAA